MTTTNAAFTEIHDFSVWGRTVLRDFQIKYTRRSWGGYHVFDRETGRRLGWVVKDSQGLWNAYASAEAFRVNQDDFLEDVPAHKVRGINGSTLQCRPVEVDDQRDWAVRGLLSHLMAERANAVTVTP